MARELVLPVLSLPSCDLRIRREGNSYTVYDALRRLWVTLTPEEWVRQHVLDYLQHAKAYPFGNIRVEERVVVNGQPQRADIVVYQKGAVPFLLVECKAAHVALTEETLWQAQIYDQVIRAPYIALCNGLATLLFQFEDGGVMPCGEDFPDFPQE